MKLTLEKYYRHTVSALLQLSEEIRGRLGAMGKVDCGNGIDIEKGKRHFRTYPTFTTSCIICIFGRWWQFRHRAADTPR